MGVEARDQNECQVNVAGEDQIDYDHSEGGWDWFGAGWVAPNS